MDDANEPVILTKQELRKTVADAAQLAVEAALASVGHTVQHALVTGTNPDHRALHDCSRSLVRKESRSTSTHTDSADVRAPSVLVSGVPWGPRAPVPGGQGPREIA